MSLRLFLNLRLDRVRKNFLSIFVPTPNGLNLAGSSSNFIALSGATSSVLLLSGE